MNVCPSVRIALALNRCEEAVLSALESQIGSTDVDVLRVESCMPLIRNLLLIGQARQALVEPKRRDAAETDAVVERLERLESLMRTVLPFEQIP